MVVEAADGRVPVIAGVGGNDTARAIRTCRQARSLGADAVLAVTPYYNKTTQAGLVAHFTALAEASELPVLLYNVPSRTGLNLLPATAEELAAHENIVGLKEACGDIAQAAETIRRCGPRLPVYSGSDELTPPCCPSAARASSPWQPTWFPGACTGCARCILTATRNRHAGSSWRCSR